MSTATKLTYLSETKNQIKDTINDLGGNVTSQTTFRNYKNQIEDLLNNYYEYLPKVTDTSANMTLTPTIKNKIEATFVGQWYQNGNPTPTNKVDIQYCTGEQTITISDAEEENTQTVELNLGNLKLYNEDYFSKEDNNWYLYSTKKEVVYDGSSDESWNWLNGRRTYYIAINDMLAQSIELNDEGDFIRCDYYEYKGITLWRDNTSFSINNGFLINNENLHIRNKSITNNDVSAFKTWLSNNNIKVVYTLTTPDKTLVTDNNIIEALNNINNMHSYLGTTKVKVESEGLSLLANVKAVEKL